MKTIVDVRYLLRRYGIFIYTGDRTGDLELMEAEIRELFQNNMIDRETFQHTLLILKHEQNELI